MFAAHWVHNSQFSFSTLYCWLGLLTCKTVSQITYTVLAGTLNTAQSINQNHGGQKFTKCSNFMMVLRPSGMLQKVITGLGCNRQLKITRICWAFLTQCYMYGRAFETNGEADMIATRISRSASVTYWGSLWPTRDVFLLTFAVPHPIAKCFFFSAINLLATAAALASCAPPPLR